MCLDSAVLWMEAGRLYYTIPFESKCRLFPCFLSLCITCHRDDGMLPAFQCAVCKLNNYEKGKPFMKLCSLRTKQKQSAWIHLHFTPVSSVLRGKPDMHGIDSWAVVTWFSGWSIWNACIWAKKRHRMLRETFGVSTLKQSSLSLVPSTRNVVFPFFAVLGLIPHTKITQIYSWASFLKRFPVGLWMSFLHVVWWNLRKFASPPEQFKKLPLVCSLVVAECNCGKTLSVQGCIPTCRSRSD